MVLSLTGCQSAIKSMGGNMTQLLYLKIQNLN